MVLPKPKVLTVVLFSLSFLLSAYSQTKPKLTLDDFFNSVDIESVKLSPDAKAVVIGTARADWDQSIFRHDLWLYRDNGQGGGSLTQLTQSGHDMDPQWSPDGKWIAFISDRKLEDHDDSSDDSDSKNKEGVNQLYVISPNGGESVPLTQGDEEVHAFGWSADGRTLYYATRIPWTKQQKDAYKKQWKDTRQYRESERPDVIFSLDLAGALARHASAAAQPPRYENSESDLTPGARKLADVPWRAQQLLTAPDGHALALATTSISQRQEKDEEFEVFVVDLKNASAGARQLTHNHAVEQHLRWAPDNHHIFFTVEVGDTSGPYRDLQPHLYWVDADTGKTEQWNQNFIGSVEQYAESSHGVVVSAREGTEVSVYTAAQPPDALSKVKGWPGTYGILSSVPNSPRIAFVYSSLERPAEVYVAGSIEEIANARPITSFNKLLTRSCTVALPL